MHKFIVKTVYGEKFGPFESDNPFLEHDPKWGTPPRRIECRYLNSQIVRAAFAAQFEENNGEQTKTIVASPDYWIEIQEEK